MLQRCVKIYCRAELENDITSFFPVALSILVIQAESIFLVFRRESRR